MTYKIKLVSQTNAAILLLSSIALLMISIWIFVPDGLSPLASYSLTAIIGFLMYFLWQKFVTGRTEWTISKDQISIVWTKKFALSNVKDINLKWNDIEKISKGFDPHYYNLKIKLASGTTLRFYHDNLTTRDDFDEIIIVLNQTLNHEKRAEKKNISIN
ncbi:hypothetical protein FRZ67_20685 [Panacibacter ginsenosidivorans]|uniref:Uncharacterized protein n=1 Tax=Panacibacter ginsenosidivorans TaxID=1813871 RepID=A0A5B8VDV8_9BACT|nr:hypothetical protein [Panacibacter ginsenosidivorans]QEC69600.1 hypothetical protein FRZ67_20685 [Panacibacter ginsenosidivorans]